MTLLAERVFSYVPMFAVIWGVFFVAGTVHLFVQCRTLATRPALKDIVRHFFPPSGWRSTSTRIDVVMYVLGRITDRLILIPVGVAFAITTNATLWSLSALSHRHAATHANEAEAILCGLAIFVTIDLSNYLTHVAQHRIPALWEIHKVHHSAEHLTPLTARRVHPIGFLIDDISSHALAGLPAGLFCFFCGFGAPNILLIYLFVAKCGSILTLDALKHSHFPVDFGALDALLVSPRMHQIHHSLNDKHLNRNFGANLAVWDWLFGTGRKPEAKEQLAYGVDDPNPGVFATVRGVYLEPTIRLLRERDARRAQSSIDVAQPTN